MATNVTRPAHYVHVMTAKLGESWYAEIEINGRLFCATGPTFRACAETLRDKARAAL